MDEYKNPTNRMIATALAECAKLTGATLARPLHFEITAVTGIRDAAQGVKVVEFVWHIKDLDET